ncbi:DNA polymerase [Pedobacter sp. WC2423]|uniref:DNA polymerase n=1 Tax=Pedobacter sp. WC2423 TaxID=3234142 RepID=UPI003466625A
MKDQKKFFISRLSNSNGLDPATYYSYCNGVFETLSTIDALYTSNTTLVSFDWDTLINWLRIRKETMPMKIEDLEQMAKQASGKKKENGPGSIWTMVSPLYDESEQEDLANASHVYYGMNSVDEEEVEKLYHRLLIAMSDCYKALVEELRTKTELGRFIKVEKLIRIINLERTYKGIALNTTNVADWIGLLTREVYRLRNRLQLDYRIISLTDRQTILRRIEEHAKITDLDSIIREKGYYYFLKDSSARHELIKLLYLEKRATGDLNALLSIGALNPNRKNIHPSYDSFGTITARTMVSSPNLQNMSRKYRSIVAAHEGKRLIYVDYAQFEAGILANDANDPQLISEYNASDIYTEIGNRIEISKFLTDQESQRKFCKSLFYKYSYGMDIKKHSNVLKDFNLYACRNELSPLIIQAFSKYGQLEQYRNNINDQLLIEGAIGTHNGNFRYKLDNENDISWALSQRIQGTASLILKKAIINLRSNHPSIEFLLPMHDAALFEVPEEEYVQSISVIKEVFINEFKLECPKIIAAANIKDFAE